MLETQEAMMMHESKNGRCWVFQHACFWLVAWLFMGWHGEAGAQLVGTSISVDGALPNTNAILDV